MSARKKSDIFKTMEDSVRRSLDAIRSESRALAELTLVVKETLSNVMELISSPGSDDLKQSFTVLTNDFTKLQGHCHTELRKIGYLLKESAEGDLQVIQGQENQDEKAVVTQSLIKKMNQNEQDQLSQGWHDFVTKLESFDNELVSSGLVTSALAPELEGLIREIIGLGEQFESDYGLGIHETSRGVVAGDVIEGQIALTNLAPLAGARILIDGTKTADGVEYAPLAEALARETDVTKKISAMEEEAREKINGLNDNPAKIKASLDQTIRYCKRIKDRMQNLHGAVFGMVARDLQSLGNYKDETTEAKMSLMVVTYNAISEGLQAYCSVV